MSGFSLEVPRAGPRQARRRGAGASFQVRFLFSRSPPDLAKDSFQEALQGLRAQIAVPAMAQGHGAIGGFAVSKHKHVRDLPELGVADPGIDLLVAKVQLHPNVQIQRPLLDGSGIAVDPVRDRQKGHLDRGQPRRLPRSAR